MADRVGVINKGELILVEEKAELMRKLGKKQLTLHLSQPLAAIPDTLSAFNLSLAEDGRDLVYTYDTQAERTGITRAARRAQRGRASAFATCETTQSSLEEIFIGLVRAEP